MPEEETPQEKKKKWQIPTNQQYQEAMKIVVNLATASLVLPMALIKNFLNLGPHEPVEGRLNVWAYLSLGLFLSSLVWSMVFVWASAKFVKLVYGGAEKCTKLTKFLCGGKEFERSEKFFETTRDIMAALSIASFAAGLFFLLVFFRGLE